MKKGWLSLLCYLKCAGKFVSFITWGFGERPIRSLLMSMGVILLATLTYFLAPESVTHGHLGRSLYFSIVTFVTLGYGDISQTSSPPAVVGHRGVLRHVSDRSLPRRLCLENQAVLTTRLAVGAASPAARG